MMQGGTGTEPKPEPSELFSRGPKAELEPSEPIFRNRNRNGAPLVKLNRNSENPSLEEPSEPKTGIANTVLCMNRNRPNRG